ncbi:hypothetical protein SZ64_04340 [Erythrobacter sp. SG61-1L]|nr:hypothetical protein SZ64_04340 [Erythrobacter sp. SG61-1L]
MEAGMLNDPDLSTAINRVHARLDGLARDMGNQHSVLSEAIGGLRSDIRASAQISSENRTAIELVSSKVHALELKEAARAGEKGVWGAIMRSPALAWLVGAGATVWAILGGHTPGAGQP